MTRRRRRQSFITCISALLLSQRDGDFQSLIFLQLCMNGKIYFGLGVIFLRQIFVNRVELIAVSQ